MPLLLQIIDFPWATTQRFKMKDVWNNGKDKSGNEIEKYIGCAIKIKTNDKAW
jgi:hypothetical protein